MGTELRRAQCAKQAKRKSNEGERGGAAATEPANKKSRGNEVKIGERRGREKRVQQTDRRQGVDQKKRE